LANRRKVVRLHELHTRQLRVELAVFTPDRQVAFREVQIAHLTRAASGGAQAHAAGVGKQVQYAFTGAVIFDPAAGIAQIEEQQRILPGMAPANTVIEAPFVPDHVFQCCGFGSVYRVFAVDPRVAAGAVVVHEQQLQAQVLVDQLMQVQQVCGFQRLVEALHQQLWAITVNGQAAGALLAAVEQAIAIGALGMQLVDQVLAMIEGGAQRLIQGRHGARLAVNEGAKFNSYGALPTPTPSACVPVAPSHCASPSAITARYA